jgi:hypothetical protein
LFAATLGLEVEDDKRWRFVDGDLLISDLVKVGFYEKSDAQMQCFISDLFVFHLPCFWYIFYADMPIVGGFTVIGLRLEIISPFMFRCFVSLS